MSDKKELSEIAKLMKRMGSKKGFDPIPPDQHAWAMSPGNPPWLRVWGWMCQHTFHWGHRSEYAIDNDKDRREMHLEHMAADLGLNDGNVRRAWKGCLLRNLVRAGTYQEGERRLYFCGEVEPQIVEDEGEETANTTVCTDVFPPHIWLKIKELPEAEREEKVRERKVLVAARKASLAELVAAQRLICDQLDDTQFRDWGFEPRRDGPKPKGTAEEIAERQARQRSIAPVIETFVLTVLAGVQSNSRLVYDEKKSGVHTDPSLLNIETTERERRASASINSSGSDRPSAASKTLPTKSRSSYTRSEPPAAPEPEPKVDEETQNALRELAEQIERMQKAYPKSDFGLTGFDPISKPGQLFLLRVVVAIGGPAAVLPFCVHVAARFKGARHALGKGPARSPDLAAGPRGLGLLLEWAKDFGRGRGAIAGR